MRYLGFFEAEQLPTDGGNLAPQEGDTAAVQLARGVFEVWVWDLASCRVCSGFGCTGECRFGGWEFVEEYADRESAEREARAMAEAEAA